jgi:hypothetical protein
VACHLIAVDNIGENRHNQLLQLSIFLVARVAPQTLRQIELIKKPALSEQCQESDACWRDGIDGGRAVVLVII